MLVTLITDLKDLLEATLHLSRDALHVHIGLAVFLAGAAALRGERRFILAFVLLLGLCLFGEVVDFAMAVRKGGGLNWIGSAKDVVSTMFWPGVWLAASPSMQRLLSSGQDAGVRSRRQEPAAEPRMAHHAFQEQGR